MLTIDHPSLKLLADTLDATSGPASGEDIAKLLGHAIEATGYALVRKPEPGDLDQWRAIVAGRAGFNGHPQALLRLMTYSDQGNLDALRLAYPAAVEAFEEERRER